LNDSSTYKLEVSLGKVPKIGRSIAVMINALVNESMEESVKQS